MAPLNFKRMQQLETTLGTKLKEEQKAAVRLILSECAIEGVTDKRQIAYVLATAWHECRFRSIREIRAKKGTPVWSMQERYWDTGYYGRGFCQLTWKKNYEKFSPIIGVDLVKEPDLLLKPEIGAKILVIGMARGKFSGVSLKKYFNSETSNWLSARKIVNGTFQADKVAFVAKKILEILPIE